jgi:hypothetical protein
MAMCTAAATVLALAMAGVPSQAAAGPQHDLAAVQISADPYLNGQAMHATQVEPDTVAAGHSVVSVFQTGRWDNGCSDNIGWAFSRDAGRNWQHGFLPGLTKYSVPAGPFDRASDPVVAYNAAFGEWMATAIDCTGTSPKPSRPPIGAAVSVSTSFDGVHWAKPVIVAKIKPGGFFDKDWITCDSTVTSRFFGNCYIEWDLPSQGELVVMSTSRDGGRTWSTPAATGSQLAGIGGEPVVQPNGTVVVPIIGLTGRAPLVAFRSTDGGRTWGKAVPISGLFQGGFAALRGPSFPSATVDQAGRIYLAFNDCRFRPDCVANDMVMTTSTDGVHWTRVTRIPIDPVSSTVDDLGGGIAVDPATSGGHARLGLFYNFYSNGSCTVSSCRLFQGFVSSTDGGAHWSTPQVLAGPMKLRQLPFAGGFMVGDYQGAAVVPGGNALSAFAVGGIPGGQGFNEAMYDASGGAPITGGPLAASSAGARAATPAKVPRIAR